MRDVLHNRGTYRDVGNDRGKKVGKRQVPAKLTFEDVQRIREAKAAGQKQREIAARFAVSEAMVSKILKGERRALR